MMTSWRQLQVQVSGEVKVIFYGFIYRTERMVDSQRGSSGGMEENREFISGGDQSRDMLWLDRWFTILSICKVMSLIRVYYRPLLFVRISPFVDWQIQYRQTNVFTFSSSSGDNLIMGTSIFWLVRDSWLPGWLVLLNPLLALPFLFLLGSSGCYQTPYLTFPFLTMNQPYP